MGLWTLFSSCTDTLEELESQKEQARDMLEHGAGLAIIPAQIADEAVSIGQEASALMAESRAGAPPSTLDLLMRIGSRIAR